MNLSALTVIASYYAGYVDPDSPQRAAQAQRRTPTTEYPPPTPSLTSNLFFRYCPSLRRGVGGRRKRSAHSIQNADASGAVAACASPELHSESTRCRSASPPSPSRSSSSASFLQEEEEEGDSGEIEVSDALTRAVPLAFSAAHPLARLATECSPAGYRGGDVLIWHRPLHTSSHRPGAYIVGKRLDGGRHRWWRHRDASTRRGKDGVRHSGTGESRSSSSNSSSGNSRRSSSSSSSSSLSRSPEEQQLEPPPPLLFSPAMHHGPAVAPAAERVRCDDASPNTTAPSAQSTPLHCDDACGQLPDVAKIVVVLRLHDWACGATSRAKDLEPSRRRETTEAAYDTVWHMMGPLLWWLERSVKPADAVHASKEARARKAESVFSPSAAQEASCSPKNANGSSADAASAAAPDAREAELPPSQNLSLCSASTTSPPPPSCPACAAHPRLSCALRLFISPWALPRRRPQILLGASRYARGSSQHATPTGRAVAPLPSVPFRWSPHAVVELGLCGPHNDTSVVFSAASFLAGLAVNAREAPDRSPHTRRRCRRRARSHDVVPAFGAFPSPHVPSGPQWPGGGGGRRGVATWRTPACATLPVQGRPSTATAGVAEESNQDDARWVQRPLLQLLGLDGVWDHFSSTSCAGPELRHRGADTSNDSGTRTASRLLTWSSLRPPLLPLHTLDLSFRTDLWQLEDILSSWAATGHLSRLCRLSVMGCIQLRGLDWLADMPANTLEELNVSGCEELRDLHAVRRLSALRSLKATQLIQLERLGWWWGYDSGREWACEAKNAASNVSAPAVCKLDRLVELDLACFRRRSNCLADMEWLGLLPSLQKLALSVTEEEDPLRQPMRHEQGRQRAALQAPPQAQRGARLAWLVECAQLRELRLAFRDGPPSAIAIAGSPVRHVHFVQSVLGSSHTTQEESPTHGSDLDVFSAYPFPHLRVLELTKGILTETFTSWLACGCTRLREVALLTCTARFSAVGLHEAQAQQTAAAMAHPNASNRVVLGRRRSNRRGNSSPLSPAPRRVNNNRSSNTASDDGDGQQRLKDEQWWWEQLCRLRHLRHLSVYDLEGCTSGSSLDWVVGCAALRHLSLRKCRWLLDAYAVHRLPRLRTLNLNATGIDDLTFLRMRDGVMVHEAAQSAPTASLPQRRFGHERVHGSERHIRDESEDVARRGPSPPAAILSPVVAALLRSSPRQLQQLLSPAAAPLAPVAKDEATVPNSRPTSLPPFSKNPVQQPRLTPTLCHLTELVLVDCPFLTDLSAIGYLTSCRSLFASDHLVTNLQHLATCAAMEKLYLINYVKLTDLSALRSLWRLRVAHITHSSVRDLSWVAMPTDQAGAGSRRATVRYASSEDSRTWGISCDTDAAVAHDRHTTARHSGGGGGDTGCVLPRLEMLTLAYSRLLTDVSALGALPRLRHLDLRDCVSLHHLGSVQRTPPAVAAAAAAASRHAGASTIRGGRTLAVSPTSSTFTPPRLPPPRRRGESVVTAQRTSAEWSLRDFTRAPLSWAGQAAAQIATHLRRVQKYALSGWPSQHTSAAVDETPTETRTTNDEADPGCSAHEHQHQQQQPLTYSPVSGPSFHRQMEKPAGVSLCHGPPKPPAPTSCSIAHLAPTLRFLTLSGCKSLVDATPLGELHELQYLYAAFTGIRDARWVGGCASLRVLDLTMSPCCTPGTPQAAAAMPLLTRLSDELTELEILNSRPVEKADRS